MAQASRAQTPGPRARPRAGYLGPEGTFSEEALLASLQPGAAEPVGLETIREAVLAVGGGKLEWAIVPIENSIEGTVTATLDTLTGEAPDVSIVGEAVLPVRHYLIGAPTGDERPAASAVEGPAAAGEGTSAGEGPAAVGLDRIGTVVSHPHVPGQCTRFLHEQLPNARFEAASSTAEAVRTVAERGDPTCAAIGTRLAAGIYGCAILREGIQDREDNETRFVWLAREDGPAAGPPLRAEDGRGPSKTSIVFWGPGADRAGWLVLCLDEFGRRGINLTKIESRPRRERLGHYMFFVDLEGAPATDEPVSQALAGLRSLCEQVRVLGAYRAAG